MRLADFILANVEPILTEWEEFARQVWPAAPQTKIDPSRLRDHAEQVLHATVEDMRSDQTAQQQSAKSKGEALGALVGLAVDRASGAHTSGRVIEGFDLAAVVAEYRALRASVIRLWRESEPNPDLNDLADLTRFNESIDQSLTGAVRSYTELVTRDREALLCREQAARQEAEAANYAKDVFLATFSHEMRTPLNAIVGWIRILRTQGRTEEHLAEGIDVIERNTKAQVQLIQDVLDISGIVSGKMRLNIAACDLRDPIHAGIDAVRPAAMARDINLEVQLDADASQASCDTTRYQQIVWNLVSNAVKFTPKGGTVRVRLARDESSLRLSVSDNGHGINPDVLPYIFDRFRQADSSTRRQFGGLGLGLSIAKHLIEMHGGTIQAHSEGENRGATFIVRLPVHSVRGETKPTAEGTGRSADVSDASRGSVRLDHLRVLIVDDEPDSLRMLSRVLEGVGANVTGTSTAQEALNAIAIEADAFDVLVSDLGMPNQDGYDLIREVRRRGHDASTLPAVALTGLARSSNARDAMAAGFQVHIPKPVDVDALTVVIASLVGRTG